MNIQPTFVNRNIDNKTPITIINAQAVIDYFLSLHPSNKLIPNSPLYILAAQQYNQNVQLSKIRPEVPSWVCGKIDPDSGEILIPPIDELLRTSSGFIYDPLDPTVFVELSPTTGYAKDNCLNTGTPGSYGYTKCIGDESFTDIDDREVSGIDWLASMAADKVAVQTTLEIEIEKKQLKNNNQPTIANHKLNDWELAVILHLNPGMLNVIDPKTGPSVNGVRVFNPGAALIDKLF